MKITTGTIPNGSSISDNELVAEFQTGSESAFGELYRRNRGNVYGVCLRILKNPEDAEDLMQDTFLKIHRKISGFRGDAQFSTWIYRMAVNLAIDTLRDKKAYQVSLDELMDATENDLPKQFGKEDSHLELTPERISLYRALSELSPSYRIVFWLHDVKGYEHREIAKALGWKIGNSKIHLSRARRKILHIFNTLTEVFDVTSRFSEQPENGHNSLSQ